MGKFYIRGAIMERLPTNNTPPTAIFAKLGDLNPTRPILYASANNDVASMSYCLGDQTACSQPSSFNVMTRAGDLNGMRLFHSDQQIALSNMMKITILASSPAGGIKKTVVVTQHRK